MDCLNIIEQDYKKFSRLIHSRSIESRIPISGSLEVTERCNLRCQHCYIPLEKRTESDKPELTLQEIKHILDELAKAGCLWLLLTGGEPFQRPDFIEIYDYAKKKGFLVSIFTNGTLITPEIADYLSIWRPFSIEISLYGFTAKTYERVTGIAGSHTRCLRGIQLLKERNIPLKLKTMVMTLNKHELTAMHEFSRQLGIEFRFDPIINSGLDGSQKPIALRLIPEEIVKLERDDPDRSARWTTYYQNLSATKQDSRQLYICSAGENSFHINSYGNLCLCQIVQQSGYNLRQGGFQEGWDFYLKSLRQQNYSEKYACRACELRSVCAQCPGVNFLETGSYEQYSPFICEIAHLRKQVFSQCMT